MIKNLDKIQVKANEVLDKAIKNIIELEKITEKGILKIRSDLLSGIEFVLLESTDVFVQENKEIICDFARMRAGFALKQIEQIRDEEIRIEGRQAANTYIKEFNTDAEDAIDLVRQEKLAKKKEIFAQNEDWMK